MAMNVRSRRSRATLVSLSLALVVLGGCGGATPSTGVSNVPAAPSSSPITGSPTVGPVSSRGPGPSGVPTSPTVAEIARLEADLVADSTNADAQRDLGLALTQRVRETADPSLYGPAMAALEAALKLQPDDALAIVGVAGIQLAKHEFADALATAERAIDLSPTLVAARTAQVDALVEVGRYDEADVAAGEMLGLQASLPTLARASYLAELRGNLKAAVGAMKLAAQSPGLAPENTAYVSSILGNLLVHSGDPAAAARAYEAALELVPGHAPSLAGQARLAVGVGKLDEAIGLYDRAVSIVPLPEYVVGLGDTQSAAGRTEDAKRSFELARALIQLFRAAGVIVDVDLALLEADFGDPAAALEYAQAAYKATRTFRTADAVAWGLHRLDRDQEALKFSTESLRLGSVDPLVRYHAGAIAAALGNEAAARRDLELALKTDPGFSATGAAEARRLLSTLP
jgi:tetratricopeptide (TPR) repeat protein